MASLNHRLNHLYAIKECSSCGNLHTKDCGCPKGRLVDKILTLEEVFQDFQDTSKSSNDSTNFVNQEPFVVKQGPGINSSQIPPQINHNCCYECGDSLDDIFCQRCTCKSCGKGAHYGYNCPPQIPIISKPEPCNNQTVNEFPQTLPSVQPTSCTEGKNSFTYDSKPNLVDDSPNVFNPPPQPPIYCEFCGNDARYGHYCTPQVPFIYPEPGYNQDFNFPQNFHGFPQQYPCCENCGGPHETYQCQPMNEDYYHEQNSCYDYNSFGFDQFQPPQYTVNHPIFNAQNELLNSQNEFLNSSNKLMEQMTTLCDMVGQAIQKKEEEKRIAEEQAAEDRYWKIPICYDDDDDYTIAITPVLPTKEPVNSLSMGVMEHTWTLFQARNRTKLSKNTLRLSSITTMILLRVSYKNIDYVDASPLDDEIVSLEVVDIVIPEVEGIDTDILLTIKDDILRCPGFLKSLVLFVLRSQELHNPQLHLGIPIS
ncbi:hypothetical protein Tco_1500680 [Tanacetum coccineum]